MDVKSRAEKIVEFLDEHNILMTDSEWDLFTKEVCAQIVEAEREIVNIQTMNKWHKAGYEDGWNACREQAARIAAEWPNQCLNCADEISTAIHQLKGTR